MVQPLLAAGPRLQRVDHQGHAAARACRARIHVCGGCLAVHKEAFRRLAFDPWITRGEDLDYMLDLRMYGSDIWFDNQWVLRHLPPLHRKRGHRVSARTSSGGSTSTASWNTPERSSTFSR